MAKTIDPVCGMEVDSSGVAWRTEIEERYIYFCGPICKQTFDNNLDILVELERLKEDSEAHHE